VVLGYLQRLYANGGVSIGSDLDRTALGEPRPRVTSFYIADELVAELEWLRYMASEYDPDRSTVDEDDSRGLLATEQAEKRLMTTGYLATQFGFPPRPTFLGLPTSTPGPLLGALDRRMRAESNYWRDRAETLERELGMAFIAGSREKRGAKVRDWVRNYRAQGFLPKATPPL
jgi:hypothetical protein